MRLIELQTVLRKQPFEPFRIQMSNGAMYEVRHPEYAFLTRTSMFVGIPPKRDGVPDNAVQVDLMHIVALEPVNGGRRGVRRRR